MLLLMALPTLASAAAITAPDALAWKLASYPDGMTEAIGVAFTTDTEGYFAGGANGVGPEILKSTDGGKSFEQIQNISFGIDILLLDAAASKKSVIVTSVFGELFSIDDGRTFRQSLGGGLSQSVRYIGHLGDGDGLHFGIAGQHRGAQGVAITKNGGFTFTAYPAKELTTLSRYACYPSQSTWYIAAGEFPSDPPPPPPQLPHGRAPVLRRARKFEMQREDGTWNTDAWKAKYNLQGVKTKEPGYSAQIVKTTDGGRTWTSQFFENNTFYFNEIDCWDEKTCCAAGESSDPPTPGVRIYCTKDGATWNRVYFEASTPGKSSYTMMGLNWVSATEVWACGGKISLIPKASFWHSTDAGQTWTEIDGGEGILGAICLGMDMKSPTLGYAAVDNVGKQQAGVAKFSSDPAPPPPPPTPPPPPAPPGSHYYGDPNAGPCLPAETAVQITGLTGSFCSPKCSKTAPCPTDVPDGATASPECVLEANGSPNPTQCALVCQPSNNLGDGSNAECPDKATCKAIQNTGLCTYDS